MKSTTSHSTIPCHTTPQWPRQKILLNQLKACYAFSNSPAKLCPLHIPHFYSFLQSINQEVLFFYILPHPLTSARDSVRYIFRQQWSSLRFKSSPFNKFMFVVRKERHIIFKSSFTVPGNAWSPCSSLFCENGCSLHSNPSLYQLVHKLILMLQIFFHAFPSEVVVSHFLDDCTRPRLLLHSSPGMACHYHDWQFVLSTARIWLQPHHHLHLKQPYVTHRHSS